MLVHPDGTGLRRLTRGAHPHWSPDGSRIVYDQFDGIYTIRVDGRGKTLLRRVSRADYDPSWSPDGTMILYSQAVGRARFGNAELWVMKADGSDPHRIARNAAQGSWQPVPAS
jgi:Tol biopolymer transport system component